MKLIPMQDFVLETEQTMKTESDFRPFCLGYAQFLKTPMTWEHFNGPQPLVKIKDVSVLMPSPDSQMGDRANQVHLLFVPDMDNEDWVGIFSVGADATFSTLIGHHGVELTEHGIKQIFG